MGNQHLHEQDNIEIQVAEVVRAIKRRAEDHPNTPAAKIYHSEVSKIGNFREEVIANLPQRNAIMRNINRIQSRRRSQNV